MPRIISMLVLCLSLHATAADQPELAKAYFAGGCFWCMEADFEKRDGVRSVVSGFTGGTLKNPTYSGNHKGHFEAVEVTYDPQVVSYQDLLAAKTSIIAHPERPAAIPMIGSLMAALKKRGTV